MAENNRGDLTITVTADVDDAVTELKRLQRELRKTTQELREYESSLKGIDDKCRICNGSGFVSIGEGVRGVRKCDCQRR